MKGEMFMKIKFTNVETPVVIDRDKVNLGEYAKDFEKSLEVKQTIYDGTYDEVLEVTNYEDIVKNIELQDLSVVAMRHLALGAFDLPKVSNMRTSYFGFRSYRDCFGLVNSDIVEDIECFEYLRRFWDNIVDIINDVTGVPGDFYVSYNGEPFAGYELPGGVIDIGLIVSLSIIHFVDRAEAIVQVYRNVKVAGAPMVTNGISNIIASLEK